MPLEDELIPLSEVVCDNRAWDGTWCTSPYLGHPHGCPNFPNCPAMHEWFTNYGGKYQWYAVVEVFDMEAHIVTMKAKHPGWSLRQCMNPLYWQGGVRKRLREKAYRLDPKLSEWGHFFHPIPEASGVNVFETMAKVGIILERDVSKVVRKVAFVGCAGDPHLNAILSDLPEKREIDPNKTPEWCKAGT